MLPLQQTNIKLVRLARFELAYREALAPQASVYTIPPQTQTYLGFKLSEPQGESNPELVFRRQKTIGAAHPRSLRFIDKLVGPEGNAPSSTG